MADGQKKCSELYNDIKAPVGDAYECEMRFFRIRTELDGYGLRRFTLNAEDGIGVWGYGFGDPYCRF